MRRSARVRPIQQMEASECGIACLAMILAYHGHWASLAEMRELCGSSRDGNSVVDLLRGARKLGLEGKGLKVPIERLSELRPPAILHWDMNHFVVLEATHRNGGVTVADPALGRRFISAEEVDRMYTGIAVAFTPAKAFVRRRRRSLSYERYVNALVKVKDRLVYVVIANAASQFLALSSPAASQVLIEYVITMGRRLWLIPVLSVLLSCTIGQLILSALQGTSQILLQTRMGLELTSQVGHRLTTVPLGFLESRGRGDLLGRVAVQTTLQSIVARTAKAGFDFVFVSLLGALMLAYDFRLGCASLAMIALRIIVLRQLREASVQRVWAELAAKGREESSLLEATATPELIKGMGLEQRLVSRYERHATERARVGIGCRQLQNGIRSTMSILGSVMEAIVMGYGGNRVIDGEMSVGVFAGFLAIRGMLEGPLGSLVGLFESWIGLRGAFERSDDVLSVQPVRRGSHHTNVVIGRVEIRNLGFRYGASSKWVLRNVTFTIEPGQRVALVGPSGQGKSTLAKIICGLLEPTEGDVLLDGIPIPHYDVACLAQHLGVVLQDPLILAGTVQEALSLRIPDATPAMLHHAACVACFDSVVAGMPGGYSAQLQALGANLSGGERQRLSVAQAIVGTPRVLVLDEATSALDPATENRVLANLDTLPSTMISVAHKPAVVAHAQRAFVVGDGCVIEIPAAGHESALERSYA